MADIVDGLLRRSLTNKAWIIALYGHIVETNKGSAEDVKAKLKRRQKRAYQKLLEKIEDKDPGYAALLDERDIGESFD